jgi:hypothetical protein
MRRPRRTGGRRGRGRRVVEDSPRASEGFTATVPGEDATGGEGRFRRRFGARIPTGGGTTRAPWCGARPPRGEGPGARDACSGAIPTGGGTRLNASLGARPHRTGGRRGLEEDYSWASIAWRPFRQKFSLGKFPFTQRVRDLPALPGSRLWFPLESRTRIDDSSARPRSRVGGECSASSGNSSASRAIRAETGAGDRHCGSTLCGHSIFEGRN